MYSILRNTFYDWVCKGKFKFKTKGLNLNSPWNKGENFPRPLHFLSAFMRGNSYCFNSHQLRKYILSELCSSEESLKKILHGKTNCFAEGQSR